jgi:hypothetical protein
MTAPLVPADVDIPRLPWVPVYADRLWESTFFAVASDAEFKAAFCLWLKSWTQKPPGSLPTDDRILCRLAELGGNLGKWKKVKRMALRHWIECDDGRLYHPVVAELVIQAANKLNAQKERTSAATANRWKSSNTNERNGLRNGHDLNSTEIPSPKSPSGTEGDLFAKNGGGERSRPAPINPKILQHAEPCHCDNCVRWAAQQRATA